MYDTIIAITTPIGESAIGVVRLSGSEALNLMDKTFQSNTPLSSGKSHTVHFGKILIPKTNEIIDEVLITLFLKPNSYTGEDVVEISCHGNPLILKEILGLYLSIGARLAEPGEFTQRAYLNGKIDLTKAEAINDLIRAHTRYSKASALNQLEGKFHKKIEQIHNSTMDILSQIEAAIDHSDLEEEFLSSEEMCNSLESIIVQIDLLLKTAYSGKLTRDGIHVAIIGAPNTGKSSLMNYLLNEDRVIVSDIPGTTRDIVMDELNIKGILVKLIDTAGVRETEDVLEKKGIEKTREAIENSDLRIVLLDSSRLLLPADVSLIENADDGRIICLLNKIDLPAVTTAEMIKEKFGIEPIPVSLINKTGLEKIEKAIFDFYFSFGVDPEKDVLVTNARQENLLREARIYFEKALASAAQKIPEEFIASDIRKARRSIEEITGKTTDDEILDRIFSKFCIGK